MGLFSRFFGGAKPTKTAVTPRPASEVRADLQRGQRVDWEADLEGRGDDDSFSLLWDGLEIAQPAALVEIIDRIAEFELTDEQAAALLLKAAEDVTRIPWVAMSVLESCDIASQVSRAAERFNEATLAAASAMVGALIEAALTAGPAGDILELEDGAKITRALARALAKTGATPAELVVLHLAVALCQSDTLDADDAARGWNEATLKALISARTSVQLGAPRGPGSADWAQRLADQVRSGSGHDALIAWQAAALGKFDVSQALLDRIEAQPTDDGTWSLALTVVDRAEILAALVPIVVEDLQHRRLREGELCSPASQIGCQSCGGADSADDDELMVPKSLEARLLPLVVACASRPGAHADLLCECLAAPSIALRYNTLAVLQRWPADAIDATLWDVIEALEDDSVPQVREAVTELLERRN